MCMTKAQDARRPVVGTLPRVPSACAALEAATKAGLGGGASGPANLAGPENAAIKVPMCCARAAESAAPAHVVTDYSSGSVGNACSRMSAVVGFTISFLRM